MEGSKVRGGLPGMWLSVCEADGSLVAELRVLGPCGKRWEWTSGEEKLRTRHLKMWWNTMRDVGGIWSTVKWLEQKARNITLVICVGWKGSRRAWREKVGRQKGYCDMLYNRWWVFYSLKLIALEGPQRVGVMWLNVGNCLVHITTSAYYLNYLCSNRNEHGF